MGRLLWAVLVVMCCPVAGRQVHAQDQAEPPLREQQPETFTAPKAYPIDRYEAGWNKNPFTLKTAPAVLEQDSFAKDLAIGSYYGDSKDPTVVLVNTKTGKRTPLRKSQKDGNDGMQLKELKLGNSSKDTVAQVSMGSQTAEVKFDNEYIKQVAGTAAARGGQQAPGPGGLPGQRPGTLPPGQQNRGPAGSGAVGQPPAQTPKVTMPPLPQSSPGRQPQQMGGAPFVPPVGATVASANRTIGTVSPATTSSTQATGSEVPVVTRRRLITPVTPVANPGGVAQ